MLNYTQNSLHPEGPRSPLCNGQPDRGKKSLDFPADLCPPAPDRAKETSAVGELRKGKQHSMQKLHLPDWSKLCKCLSVTGHTGEVLPSSVHLFFLGVQQSQEQFEDWHFCRHCVPRHWRTSSSCPQGLLSWDLTEGQKSSWAVAHKMAFCAGILSCPC